MLGIDDVRLNEYIMLGVFFVCGKLGVLEYGKWVYIYIDKSSMKINIILGIVFVDMYVKCGSIERVRWVFDELGFYKDVKIWSVMISGFVMYGYDDECFDFFLNMLNYDLKFNLVIFLGVFCVCVYCGLVLKGEKYFIMMIEEFGICFLI